MSRSHIKNKYFSSDQTIIEATHWDFTITSIIHNGHRRNLSSYIVLKRIPPICEHTQIVIKYAMVIYQLVPCQLAPVL